jgi:predicted acylesterase/phospholipase RssA
VRSGSREAIPVEEEHESDVRTTRAEELLRGKSEASAEEVLALALRLRDAQEFGLARKLLRRIPPQGLGEKAAVLARQQHAICTYKDPDIPLSARLARALEILAEGECLATTVTQETLGIAGAIHKRKWETTMRVAELERSLHYYHRGFEQGFEDLGYTAINAAFVLDLLADAEGNEPGSPGAESDVGDAPRRAEADEIRRAVIAALGNRAEEEQGWWLRATVAEAHLGLGHYADARRWLASCAELGAPPWVIESTARQIGALAILRASDDRKELESGAREALEALLGEYPEAVTTAFAGKVGVALSGGGFRASLFHIGLLARLAELDMLRHVEVLSCVSGGSIVGAHYYLEVQHLLESKVEAEICRDDYVEIVARIERDFLAGVQENIRTRVVGNARSNLRSAFDPTWTRTRRAGEEYEARLFARVGDGRSGVRYMTDLLMNPLEERSDSHFKPKRDNWRRRCKVPILVLNASTLNTGHNWQFTASWMGEPPAVVDEEIDPTTRLRRMYYGEAPEDWQQVRLGDAVAASACVPGLFEPLVLDKLYDGMSVELVDGGVHDNQGIASLIEQECSVMIVSDASGQIKLQKAPRRGPIAVPLRSSSILSARVREAQLRDLIARHESSALRGVMMLHLRKGLGEPPADWIGCRDPYDAADDVTQEHHEIGEEVPAETQRLLAGIRTDLDSFSDMEAYALMLSGYRMAERSFGPAISGFPVDSGPPHRWGFLAVAGTLEKSHPRHLQLQRVLTVGAGRWLKAWKLYPWLKGAGIASLAVAAMALVFLLWVARGAAILTPGALLAIAAIAALVFGLTRWLAPRLDLIGTVLGSVTSLLLVFASIPAFVHLRLLDRLYLRYGRMENG